MTVLTTARLRLIFLHTIGGLLMAAPAFAEDSVVARKFGVGPGAGSVGRAPAGEGTEFDGPQAIYAGKNGEIYLLDQVNGRVISFDGRDSDSPTRSLTLPNGIEPTDMIATGSGLIVWDGKPIALEAKGEGLTRSLTVTRDATAASDETVLSMFGQTGSQDPGSADDAKASATRSAGKGGSEEIVNGPVKKSVATHGAGPVTAIFTPDAGRTAMDIAVNSKSSQAKLGKLHLRTRAQLGAVELLEIDNLGRFYVMVEVVPSGQGAGAQTFIARFAQNSTFEGTYELPLKPDVALARRFVTVSPDGDVYFLRTRKGTVDVLGVGFAPMAKTKSIDQRRPGKQPADQPVLTQPSTKATDAAPRLNVGRTAIAAVGPLNRQRVVETAFAFESIKWPVTSATYGNDPDRQCSGFDRIRRPGYLRGQLNHEARGVPYCWGCSGSLAQFASRIERGSLAGNVCTRDEPRRDVAGVDCSSFVSAAWGLSTHFTTSAIPSIAAPIDDPWSMKPGDAFNKPNSHVMLFLGYTADRKAQVMEASPGACNGRVCRNVYPIASLLARGYTPRRFRGLEGDMSSAHIALADAPPGPTVGGMSRPSGKSKTTVGRPGNSHVAASAPEAAGPVAGKQKGRANAAAEPKAAPGESWSNKIFADRR